MNQALVYRKVLFSSIEFPGFVEHHEDTIEDMGEGGTTCHINAAS